jgi:hypothetical protein
MYLWQHAPGFVLNKCSVVSNRDAGIWDFGVNFCAMVMIVYLSTYIYGPFGSFFTK